MTTPVEQKRKLVTSIPGPKSSEIIARRAAAVSAALGMAMPAVIERAAGGILVDIDGNLFAILQAVEERRGRQQRDVTEFTAMLGIVAEDLGIHQVGRQIVVARVTTDGMLQFLALGVEVDRRHKVPGPAG